LLGFLDHNDVAAGFAGKFSPLPFDPVFVNMIFFGAILADHQHGNAPFLSAPQQGQVSVISGRLPQPDPASVITARKACGQLLF
jgi:hypothetical protein